MKAFYFLTTAFIAMTLSSNAEANWVREPFDPSDIVDYQISHCLIEADRKILTAPDIFPSYRSPPKTTQVKRETVKWDNQTQSTSLKLDQYFVNVKRIAEKKDLPINIHDKQKWTTALGDVPFLSVEVTDLNGNKVQLRNFDHVKVDVVTLDIGNYNGTYFDLYASNMSSQNLIVVYDRFSKTHTDIVVHCGVDAVFR